MRNSEEKEENKNISEKEKNFVCEKKAIIKDKGFVCLKMMKTLTLSPSSADLMPQQSKLSNIQEILSINNENDNGNSNTTDTPRLVNDKMSSTLTQIRAN